MAKLKPIKILHVVDNLGRGGTQNILRILIDRLDPERYEHVVCGVRRLEYANADLFSREQARVMCLNWQDVGGRFQVMALARVLREVRPAIVHSRNWCGIESVFAGRLVGSCALVHSEHGMNTDTAKREPRRRSIFRRMAYELADQVMCVSHQLKGLYAERTGFSERRMTVIHNGVDASRFFSDPVARVEVRRELGVAAEEFCIGCVGNLTSVKDYPTVLNAVNELARAGLNWRLFVAGEGLEQDRVEGILREHPEWSGRVSLLGAIDRVPLLLRAMDVYVLSSVTEGISNALLEAMATGLPVVATATGGNPEVVQDGESGLLFPVGDSLALADRLRRLYARPELRQDLSRGALERVRLSFSLGAMIDNYCRMYEGLADRHAARLGGSRMRLISRREA